MNDYILAYTSNGVYVLWDENSGESLSFYLDGKKYKFRADTMHISIIDITTLLNKKQIIRGTYTKNSLSGIILGIKYVRNINLNLNHPGVKPFNYMDTRFISFDYGVNDSISKIDFLAGKYRDNNYTYKSKLLKSTIWKLDKLYLQIGNNKLVEEDTLDGLGRLICEGLKLTLLKDNTNIKG